MTSHEFAFFSFELSHNNIKGSALSITDKALVHRIIHVVRCKVGQQIILFTHEVHAVCIITDFTKKTVLVSCGPIIKNVILKPSIYVLLPLLKREAFDEALYSCGELGVTGIQLIKTLKCSRQTISHSEQERIERLMCAAAEQSKQFAFPYFLNQGAVVSLNDFFSLPQSEQIFKDSFALCADLKGGLWNDSLFSKIQSAQSIIIAIGPEGDFVKEEKELLKQQGFVSCVLGPTVLRAQQAVTVLAGMLRTLTFSGSMETLIKKE